MLSPKAKWILDAAGIEVVRATYAKELTVRVLPRDAGSVVEFNEGQVSLGEVDEWLKQYSRTADRWIRTAAIAAIVAALIAFLAWLFPNN